MYGDELDGEEDRNDGLNALVSSLIHSFIFSLCSTPTLLIYALFRIFNGS
jgi:hypothetical protein